MVRFQACCIKWQREKVEEGGGDHGDLEGGLGSEVVGWKGVVLLTW